MPYMLLVMEPNGQRDERTLVEGHGVYDRMLAFTEDLRARGLLIASNSLRSAATRVRVDGKDGRSTLLDGPFTEAKELVGGFFYLDCGTKDEALAIAAACPAAEWAAVEVREVGTCYE